MKKRDLERKLNELEIWIDEVHDRQSKLASHVDKVEEIVRCCINDQDEKIEIIEEILEVDV